MKLKQTTKQKRRQIIEKYLYGVMIAEMETLSTIKHQIKWNQPKHYKNIIKYKTLVEHFEINRRINFKQWNEYRGVFLKDSILETNFYFHDIEPYKFFWNKLNFIKTYWSHEF